MVAHGRDLSRTLLLLLLLMMMMFLLLSSISAMDLAVDPTETKDAKKKL